MTVGPSVVDPYWNVDLPPEVYVPTRVERWAEGEEIPITLEVAARADSMSDHSPDARDVCVGAMVQAPCGRTTLGAGRPLVATRKRGGGGLRTLSAVVIDAYCDHLLLTAAHNLEGATGQFFLPDGDAPVAQMQSLSAAEDAALLRPSPETYLSLSLLEPEVLPRPPLMVPSRFPVQMFGAVSGHRVGHIDQTYSFPVSGPRILGATVDITTDIRVRHGDSGALLVTGHTGHHPYAASRSAGYLNPSWLREITCSALGILSTGTAEDAPSEIPRTSGFVALPEVLATFEVQLALDDPDLPIRHP